MTVIGESSRTNGVFTDNVPIYVEVYKTSTNFRAAYPRAAALKGTRIYFDTATNLLAVGGNEGGLALDVETGAIKKEFTALNNGKTHSLFPLEHDRFATVAARWDDFEIWDAKTGKVSERLTMSGLPAGPPNANTLQIALSQNKKYVAIGRVGTPALDYAELPFKVVEAATRKVVVPGDWHGGSAHFTTDSARVLVAEWTGRAKWYKIPSGEPDGGWDFGPPQAGRINTVHGIAANGSLVAYSGPGVDKGTGETLGLLDGKTGRIIRTFKKEYLDSSPIALAENGQRVALLRAPQPASDEVTRSIDVIDVVSGAAFNSVQIDSGESPPTFHLTPDGKALVVHDAAARKVYFFETIAPKLK